jgi:hypothetical protein
MPDDKEIISEYMSKLGKKSASKMTKKQRKERAQKAINARWEKNGKITPWQKTLKKQ